MLLGNSLFAVWPTPMKTLLERNHCLTNACRACIRRGANKHQELPAKYLGSGFANRVNDYRKSVFNIFEMPSAAMVRISAESMVQRKKTRKHKQI